MPMETLGTDGAWPETSVFPGSGPWKFPGQGIGHCQLEVPGNLKVMGEACPSHSGSAATFSWSDSPLLRVLGPVPSYTCSSTHPPPLLSS